MLNEICIDIECRVRRLMSFSTMCFYMMHISFRKWLTISWLAVNVYFPKNKIHKKFQGDGSACDISFIIILATVVYFYSDLSFFCCCREIRRYNADKNSDKKKWVGIEKYIYKNINKCQRSGMWQRSIMEISR